MSAHGGKKAILAALTANAGIAVAKFVGYAITGSSSMLAEAVHSVADTSNQGLLLFGQRQAAREADQLHPFGYGRSRYFYSFVVALVLFTLGSMFATYEGIHKISHPEDLTSPIVAVVILVIAIGLESYSFMTAIKESRPLKGDASWWQFIRNSRSPELPVVLLEDAGALIGLVLALLGVGLSIVTDNPVFDGIGTLCIGVLLGIIAIILIIEMQSLLIGEGATAAEEQRILQALISPPGVSHSGLSEPGLSEPGAARIERVIHCKTQYLGPEELLVAAKIAVRGEQSVADLAKAIDDAEVRVRLAVPAARVIYLEPDLDRAPQRS